MNTCSLDPSRRHQDVSQETFSPSPASLTSTLNTFARELWACQDDTKNVHPVCSLGGGLLTAAAHHPIGYDLRMFFFLEVKSGKEGDAHTLHAQEGRRKAKFRLESTIKINLERWVLPSKQQRPCFDLHTQYELQHSGLNMGGLIHNGLFIFTFYIIIELTSFLVAFSYMSVIVPCAPLVPSPTTPSLLPLLPSGQFLTSSGFFLFKNRLRTPHTQIMCFEQICIPFSSFHFFLCFPHLFSLPTSWALSLSFHPSLPPPSLSFSLNHWVHLVLLVCSWAWDHLLEHRQPLKTHVPQNLTLPSSAAINCQ